MVLLLSRIVRAIPLAWAMALGRGMAWIWYYLVPVRRGVARHNVARALGHTLSPQAQRRVVRRAMSNLCCYAIEALRMPGLTPALSRELVQRENFECVDELLLGGKGVIAVTAHLGNIDLLGSSQTVRGYPIHAIVKDIHWAPAQEFFLSARNATNLGTVPPKRSKERIRQLLHQNQIVAFLIDQHMAPHRGIVCSLFGQLASTSPAPVRFAFETGAPIMPISIVRTAIPGHHLLRVEPEFKLETPFATLNENIRFNTERLNRLLERWILETPEQWLWMHKRWKVHDDPRGWDIPPELSHLRQAPASERRAKAG